MIQKNDVYFALESKKKTVLYTRKMDCTYDHVNSKQRLRYREIAKKLGDKMLQQGKATLKEGSV